MRAIEGRDVLEQEANEFANELLMPSKLLLKEKGPFTERRIKELAKEYGVTEIRMAYRLASIFDNQRQRQTVAKRQGALLPSPPLKKGA